MRWISVPRSALLYGIVIVLLGGLILGGAFVLSGIYNVAASVPHFGITNAIIRTTLRRSVVTHSMGVQPPENLSDESLARLGARHFALGCAPCHGSPAATQNPIAAEMYPVPPSLSHAVEDWETEELFWIVKHGFKFTGMPSWPAAERDEEVWALVAFLERMPDMSGEEYAALTGQRLGAAAGASSFAFGPDASAEDVAALCANCHDGRETAPVHSLAPGLGGQKQAYLERALREYAEERRPSGIMEPIAAELGPEAISELARHYAENPRGPLRSQESVDPESVQRGRSIAIEGSRENNIPACLSCHSNETSGEFPRLDGLSQEYIVTQLRLFQNDIRDRSTYAQIMQPIARRLTSQQIEDLAAYFSSRMPNSADNTPAPEGAE